ncbi:MAG TPA: 2-oxo acid dehydrogenase subunit E2, partial [Gammaproteobacteria bacterium]|nr:2-oxo acid dehydrogenase subunit E2 [Gammaproteobacteria bacterium]
DVIQTGRPLIGFVGEAEKTSSQKDSGTVVGHIQTSEIRIAAHREDTSITTQQITPAVRALAKKLNVDLTQIQKKGHLSVADVKTYAATLQAKNNALPEGAIKLDAMKQAMVLSMSQSHHDAACVSLMDVADIHHWEDHKNVTIRIIRAMQTACEQVPILNSWFYAEQMAYVPHPTLHLGLAIDTEQGLYVPVIRDVAKLNDAALREQINHFKKQAQAKSIAQKDLHGATMLLSNYGALAGRYATPLIVPPTVAIIGVGHTYEQLVKINDQIESHKMLPISATADHRLITGGELARFLQALIKKLAK